MCKLTKVIREIQLSRQQLRVLVTLAVKNRKNLYERWILTWPESSSGYTVPGNGGMSFDQLFSSIGASRQEIFSWRFFSVYEGETFSLR
jgi:hypothetical protein